MSEGLLNAERALLREARRKAAEQGARAKAAETRVEVLEEEARVDQGSLASRRAWIKVLEKQNAALEEKNKVLEARSSSATMNSKHSMDTAVLWSEKSRDWRKSHEKP